MTTATHYHHLTEDEISRFWEDGFLVVPDALDKSTIATAKQAILDLIPRDFVFGERFASHSGRLKPHNEDGSQSYYTPELLPLLINETLYKVMVDLFETEYLRVSDGSVGITLKDAGPEGLTQRLHLDMRRPTPEQLSLEHVRYNVGMGGCYYLSGVEQNGAGIHVIPGGHRMAEEIMLNEEGGLQRFENWRQINDLAPSVEVTANAGDFVLMHHMMPHGASRNLNPTPRVAQFTRFYRLTEEEAHQAPGPDRELSADGMATLTPLGRKLFRFDPWIG
ncbi:MAG: phytanoyl-CoA dioxygenase family protein [Candidatus Latescibacterota bacterium]|nr:phytanoyl-CoA dioxygenase family protein [Candidatus Latescibacterota bacterium]